MSAYIVQATRTAAGKAGKSGSLRNIHPVTLGATVINSLLSKVPSLDPADVDDVIFGCVTQIGENAANMARNCVLSSALPISVPGTTVDRQCGSSQQAIHFAAQAVMSGTQDIVIAGGVESMTRVPMFSNMSKTLGHPNDDAIKQRFNIESKFFSQFVGAEMMGVKYGISREEMDAFAARSHERASAAWTAGHYDAEVCKIMGHDKEGLEYMFGMDEGIRFGTTAEKLGGLQTLIQMGVGTPVEGGLAEGTITAGNASQMSDGAAAILIVNDEGLKKLGTSVTPLARIHSLALAANDPVLMLSAPIPATQNVLKRGGLTMNDLDLYEVNEAFAVVPLAWAKMMEADQNLLNVSGGACALGHPLGATGAKLMTHLVHELVRQEKRYGLLTICEGGGTANATIIERC
jgi:acetyl-CoA C-acetyltransferase